MTAGATTPMPPTSDRSRTWPSAPSAAACSGPTTSSFAERENLLKPEAPVHDTSTFGHKGKVYDGWETRRRREPGFDEALVRLGAPGVVHGVVVDTAYFKGNYPPEVSVDATCFTGLPVGGRAAGRGRPGSRSCRAPRSRATPRTRSRPTPGGAGPTCGCGCTPTAASPGCACTARRCPTRRCSTSARSTWPRWRTAAGSSTAPTSSTARRTTWSAPAQARIMGEGWETARRRDDGNDWVVVRLAGDGIVRLAELDTMYFKGNAPGAASLSGFDGLAGGDLTDPDAWFEILPKRRLEPDTRHRFLIEGAAARHARPDGHLPRRRDGPAPAVRRALRRGSQPARRAVVQRAVGEGRPRPRCWTPGSAPSRPTRWWPPGRSPPPGRRSCRPRCGPSCWAAMAEGRSLAGLVDSSSGGWRRSREVGHQAVAGRHEQRGDLRRPARR